jgi:hypothetical protein
MIPFEGFHGTAGLPPLLSGRKGQEIPRPRIRRWEKLIFLLAIRHLSGERGTRDMGKFLIEVPHEEEIVACARVVEIFLKTGSHFVTHADWGCRDGEHKAWILIDVDNKEEARRILPPAFRSQAKIVSLNKFSMEEIDDLLHKHRGLPVNERIGNQSP